MDIRDIRLANLKTLIRERAGGNNAKFVELAGLESHTALLHVTGPRRTRNLGSRLARKIEHNLNLGAGWMDRDHSTEAGSATPGDGGRVERALRFYDSVEKLPPKALKALEQFINLLHTEQKKTKRRKKKSDSLKR